MIIDCGPRQADHRGDPGDRYAGDFHGLYLFFHFGVNLGLTAADAAALPGGGQAGHGAFPDQVALELSQSGEDMENQLAGGAVSVDFFSQALKAHSPVF